MMNKNIKRILLINPQGSIRFQPDGSKQVKDCPVPLGLAYLAAQLRNYEVKVYDMIVENFYREETISDNIIMVGSSLEEYKELLMSYKPDLVGISCILSNRSDYVSNICKTTKQFNKDTITVVGGHHVSGVPEHLLQGDVDFEVLGEGEYRFPKLIDTLNGKGNLSKIDGLAYKHNGEIKIQPQLSWVKDLDKLPFPAWDIVEIEKYQQGRLAYTHGVPLQSNKYATMLSSRGCPHSCDYCAVPVHLGKKIFRSRTLNSIISEIEWLISKYGIEEIHFEDDNFFCSKKRAKELCKEFIRRFPGMHFAVTSGSDPTGFDYELMDLLKEAGFHHLTFGIETGDMDIQGKFVDKKINLSKIKDIVRYAIKADLNPSGFFLLGFPYETKEQIKRTIGLATSLELERIFLAMVSPLPGSFLYHYCKENNLLYEDFDFNQVNASNTYIKNPNISREKLEAIRRNVWQDYMSKRIDINKYGTSGFSGKTKDFLEQLEKPF